MPDQRDSYFIRWTKLCEAYGLPHTTTAEALIARMDRQGEEIEHLQKRIEELEDKYATNTQGQASTSSSDAATRATQGAPSDA